MRCPTLDELPPAPAGREGWPWNVETPPSDVRQSPAISVVTPSFNQAAYLEETIRSVLLQGYAGLEYIIMDGGSTDGSVEIIRKYAPWISHWVSEKDGGQAHAVNKGFRLASGALVGWQNSDDYYYPGAFHLAAAAASSFPDFDVYFGDKDYVDAQGRFLFTRKNVVPTFADMIPWACMNNESMFLRRQIFERGYFLDETRKHYMDYDFFFRLFLDGFKFKHVPGMKAGFRQHPEAKSSSQVDVAQGEGFDIYRMAYLSGKAPADARELLVEAMRTECHNDFSHYRFPEFRRHRSELIRLAGRTAIPPGLNIRYLATFLGVPFIHACRWLASS
jgi:glycosyltransferase involved in cell wall biosynthesis